MIAELAAARPRGRSGGIRSTRYTIYVVKILLLSTYELGRQPFGLASPAAWLRRRGHSLLCCDLSRQTLDEAAVREAELIVFYLPMHTATRLALQWASVIRAQNPDATLSACGLYAPLNEAHVRASSAIPALFPAVRLDDGWHFDGGTRLNAPIKPALAFGATLGLARGAVLTSCIHTHAGPSTIAGGHLLGWITPPGYRETLVAGCVAAARAAEAAAVPATLRAGRAALPAGLSLNRRGLPYDPAFSVVDVLGAGGARLGTIANVSIHPVALGPECLAVSSDWGVSDEGRRAKFYRLTAAGRKRIGAEEEAAA